MSRFEEVEIIAPIEDNGAIPVNIQDQYTPPVDAYFSQEVSSFTLAANTGESTLTTLVYTFTVTPGHGIAVDDVILLLDTADSRILQAAVTVVATNTITIDRPIDHTFPSASTLGKIVNINMAVDGSVTPQIFAINAGAIDFDIIRFILTMTDGSAMDYSTFGGMDALENGLVLRTVNGFQKTIFNFKTNKDIAQFCYDEKYADKAPSGEYGLAARGTFGGRDKHGVVLRLSGSTQLQWVVQDDLTDLITLEIIAQGHEVVN